ISALTPPSADLRMVLKSAAKLKHLAPDAICVADPLAFTGCGRNDRAGPCPEQDARGQGPGQIPLQVDITDDAAGVAPADSKAGTNGNSNGPLGAKKLVGGLASRNGIARAIAGGDRPVHPVTLWRGRLSVAIEALET